VGVFANQPAPVASLSKHLATYALLCALFIVILTTRATGPHSRTVAAEGHTYLPELADSAAIVVGPFRLQGRPSNLEVGISTNLSNAWTYFSVSLLNLDSGSAVHFGRAVSYYFGRDADGSWREGSPRSRPRVPSVPAGEYLLRIVPEGPTPTDYTVTLRRDVPQLSSFLIAFIALTLPLVAAVFFRAGFESTRWAESDYAAE
jgi:hypothetical protein